MKEPYNGKKLYFKCEVQLLYFKDITGGGNMASIVKRGKTYSVVYYEKVGGVKKQVWESGLNYSEAKLRKAEIEYETLLNTHIETDGLTVISFLNEFVEKYGKKKWVASTYKSNVGLFENYVYPYVGDMKIEAINTKTIDDYYDMLLSESEPVANLGSPDNNKVSPSLICSIHKVLRCAFNQAVKWGYIKSNPFIHATLPERSEKERATLSPQQLYRVMEFTDRPNNYNYYMMHCALHLAFSCSLRGGEVGGAQWDKFNEPKHMLLIDRVIDRVDKNLASKLPKMEIYYKFPNILPGTKTVVVLKQPKTKGSVRNVYIPETVVKKLQTLRELQKKNKRELLDDGYTDYGLIICQANGRPVLTEFLNKQFKEILQAMNDPTINANEIVFHSVRHTSAGAKLLISKGDLKSVQGDGGWSTPDMVTKRYSHIFDENRQKLAWKLERDFYQKKGVIEPETFNSIVADDSHEADANKIVDLLLNNPDLLIKVLKSALFANNG